MKVSKGNGSGSLNIAILMGFMLLLCACGSKSAVPSNYDKISLAVGLSQKEALQKLDIREEQLCEDTLVGIYGIPEQAKFEEFVFATQLGFDMTTEKKELMDIQYVLDLSEDSKKNKETGLKIFSLLEKAYGKATSSNIKENLHDDFQSGTASWDLTNKAEKNIKTYMTELESRYNGSAQYLLDLLICGDDGDAPRIILMYKVRVMR